MKELTIQVRINDNDQMAIGIRHKGFSEKEQYSLSQIHETLGILESVKQSILERTKIKKVA
jgi:hypothetical protein